MQIAVIRDLKKAVRVQKEGKLRFIPATERDDGAMPHWSTHPTLEDVQRFFTWYGVRKARMACDFEVQMSTGDPWCLGLWPVDTWLSEQGICIPFRTQTGRTYWSSFDYWVVHQILERFFADPEWKKWGQNWVGFDHTIVEDYFGLESGNVGLELDTLVAWHSVYAELPQALAFQSSLVTDLGAYKLEVHKTNVDDEEEDDSHKGWNNIDEIDDTKLRVYCMRDCFATAGSGLELEGMMI
jgi:hypothetical protein